MQFRGHMTNRTRIALAAALASLVYGCGGADSSSDSLQGALPDDPTEQPGAQQTTPDSPSNPNASTTPDAPTTPGTATNIALALSTATPVTDLGTSTDITVTVTPMANASGTVTFSTTGLPTGVTATFAPATVTLGAAAVTTKLTLMVPYTTVPTPKDSAAAIVVKATAGQGEATANANFKVNPQVTLTVPMNATALEAAGGGSMQLDTWGGPTFGKNGVPLSTQGGNAINLLIKNLDSTPHEIHMPNNLHGNAKIPAGGMDSKVRTLDPAASTVNASGYIHGEPNGGSVGFKLSVVKAP